MELRHLRYFIAVAETLNFHRAAENLHISQPPLSLQIKDLEYELGTALFTRDKKRIYLTEAGQLFFTKAKNILHEVNKAKAEMQRAKEGKIGCLSIRFISSAVSGVLQKTLMAFKSAYPHVDLNLEQSNVELILNDVRNGKIDLGFIRTPIQDFPDITMTKIIQESYFVALPQKHPLSKKDQVSIKDLKNEKLIIYPRNTASGSYDDILSLFSAKKIVPEIIIEAVEQLTIAGLVATSMGYSIVPECMTKIKVPNIIHLPLKEGLNRTGIAIIAKKSCHPLVKNFLAHLKTNL